MISMLPEVVAVELNVSFTCNTSNVMSQPAISHHIFYKEDQESSNETSGTSWVKSFGSINDSVGFSCLGQNIIGNGVKSEQKQLTVQGKE